MVAPGPQPGLASAAPGKPLGSSGDRDSSRVSPPACFVLMVRNVGWDSMSGVGAELKPGLQAGQETASPSRGGGLHHDRGSWLGKTQPVTPPPQLCLPLLRPQVAPQGSRSPFALARPWGPPGRLGRASRTCTCLHGKGPLDPSRVQTHLATGRWADMSRRHKEGTGGWTASILALQHSAEHPYWGEGMALPPHHCLPGQQPGLMVPGGVQLADHHQPCPSPAAPPSLACALLWAPSDIALSTAKPR